MVVKQESGSLRKKKSKLINSRNSLSENDLRTTRYQEFLKTGLPPGITVDELWLYCRKRRPNPLPQDNLKLLSGSYENIKSEYNKHYTKFYNTQLLPTHAAVKPADQLIIKDDDDESFIMQDPISERPRGFQSGCDSFRLIHDNGSGIGHESDISENKSRYIRYSPIKRPDLQKRLTSLKLDGDFLTTTTEYREKFIQHLFDQRPLNKLTTLKIDSAGKMDVQTENREKFVKYDDYQQCRPPLCRKFTNLHLEGDLKIVTENQEKFIDYPREQLPQQRPRLIKKLTNLHIGSGEIDLIPEYRKEFIEYGNIERSKLILPNDNLKTDGSTGDNNKNDNARIHPQIPFLRDYHHQQHAVVGKLEKSPSDSRNAYIDSFNRNKEELKPTRRILQQHPPYKKSNDVDLAKESSLKKRPKFTLSSSDEQLGCGGIDGDDAELLKRVPDVQLDEHFECRPEYRKAYINYLQREHLERKPRTLDHLKCAIAKRTIEIESVVETPQPQPLPPPPQSTETRSFEKKSDHRSPSSIKRNNANNNNTKKKSLGQIEANLFGPKLAVGRKSRSPSPSLSTSASASSSFNRKQPVERDNKMKKFDKSILVENLAATIRPKTNQPRLPPPTPPPTTTTITMPLLNVTTRNKWMRDSSIESTQSTAFVVLEDKEQIIVNNNVTDNYVQDVHGYYSGRRRKEQ